MKQPKRSDRDGDVRLAAMGPYDDTLVLEVTQGAITTSVEMSRFNAYRACALLAGYLGIDSMDDLQGVPL